MERIRKSLKPQYDKLRKEEGFSKTFSNLSDCEMLLLLMSRENLMTSIGLSKIELKRLIYQHFLGKEFQKPANKLLIKC